MILCCEPDPFSLSVSTQRPILRRTSLCGVETRSQNDKAQRRNLDTELKLGPFALQCSTTSALIKVSAYEGGYRPRSGVSRLNFNKEAYGSTANINPKVYNLHSCTGMAYWKNQLVVYGPKKTVPCRLSATSTTLGTSFPNKADTLKNRCVCAAILR